MNVAKEVKEKNIDDVLLMMGMLVEDGRCSCLHEARQQQLSCKRLRV